MLDAVALERQGIPTAVICTEALAKEARIQAETLGMATLNPVIIPHPLSTLTDEEIKHRADTAWIQCLERLIGQE